MLKLIPRKSTNTIHKPTRYTTLETTRKRASTTINKFIEAATANAQWPPQLCYYNLSAHN